MRRLRDLNFAALCRQNIGFFDAKNRTSGAFVTNLTVDRRRVTALSAQSLGQMTQAAFLVVGTLIFSFVLGSWLLTLVVLAVVPVIVQAVRYWQLKGRDAIADELAESGDQASEVLTNIRTIASLGMEEAAAAKYLALMEEPMTKGQAQAQINGLAIGFNAFVMTAAEALVLWYGAKLVGDSDITVEQMLCTVFVIMIAIEHLSGLSSFFGNTVPAYKAGGRILSLIEWHVPINAFDDSGLMPMTTVNGDIEFKSVEFRYPTRTEVAVLANFNLTIKAGETVAFCDASGGGKSTVVSLIERFYVRCAAKCSSTASTSRT